MAERLIRCLQHEAISPEAVQLNTQLHTDTINKKACDYLVNGWLGVGHSKHHAPDTSPGSDNYTGCTQDRDIGRSSSL